MYTTMYVEYVNHIDGSKNTEILNWNAFCELSCERNIEITFCCAVTDPRVNQE